MNLRKLATLVILDVVQHGRALDQALLDAKPKLANKDQSLLHALCYGTLRHYELLHGVMLGLLDKPLKAKDLDLQILIYLGLYQLYAMRIPPHAAVAETVAACKSLRKGWARGLVNAILRNFTRQQQQLIEQAQQQPEAKYQHPEWLITQIQADWPEHWQAILLANVAQAPMTLRVNAQHTSRDSYLQQLAKHQHPGQATPYSEFGVMLNQASAVTNLPGFSQGLCSVQDEAAQLAATLVDPQAQQRVLDACAAPGGKSCHLLELQPSITLHALDQDPARLSKVQENLDRLDLKAKLICGDGTQPDEWWDGQPYDRILLDAPCSATGVIRRHPDIKQLRQAEDITQLSQTQSQMLSALWPLLAPGGLLVYATCSIFKQENSQQIQQFVQSHSDAEHQAIAATWGIELPFGRQLLPQIGGHDGFYYACIKKLPSS